MSPLAEAEVFTALCEILREVKKLKQDVTREDDIRKLGLDSLDVINYLFSIEEKFGIDVPVETLDEKDLFTIGAMVDHLCAAA
ncbi:MAG: phosphopantetheine-binding protein [Desulfarculus sp.]|nr:phosphopantetheine-binding protein [Desulfarculus sp.]